MAIIAILLLFPSKILSVHKKKPKISCEDKNLNLISQWSLLIVQGLCALIPVLSDTWLTKK